MNKNQKIVLLIGVILLFLMLFDLLDFVFDPDIIDDHYSRALRNFLLASGVVIISSLAGIFAFKDSGQNVDDDKEEKIE